jgi:hypothetical protein
VSSFRYTPQSGQLSQVNTHSAVLRNTGRKSATNIRLHHIFLPEFNIWPAIVHSIETLPDGSKDIVIPTLVPSEEITISYLYFPLVVATQVNSGIKCDQGFSNQITVLLQRQFPRWFNRTVLSFFFIGVVTVLYFVYVAMTLLLR